MSKKITLKGDIGKIDVELKDLTFAERKEFNDILYEKSFTDLNFSDYVNLVQIATNLTDEMLNNYSDTDIAKIADRAYVLINNKKK
jgi:hypothetical protein